MFHLDVKMIHETFLIGYETFIMTYLFVRFYICKRNF